MWACGGTVCGMLDVSAYMAAQLQAHGITCPACEGLMLSEVDGPYITWDVGTCKELMASGAVYMRMYPVELTLWVPAEDTGWRELQWRIADALGGGAARPASVQEGVWPVAYGLTGAEDVPAIRRKAARMIVHVHERG